jgi:inner membrane protein
MTTPNHLAGGLVFTGIIASLFSVNIFSEPSYLLIIGVGSLLPDIDTPKSIIGKAVYPISKLISRKYAHRTITHSLLFLIAVTVVFHYINKFYIHLPLGSTILFFSVFSHFVLDMITVQGIPFFYPFIKNPCVIPGKVEFRLTTGNLRQEGIAFFMFTLLLFTMQDLFAQGFWAKYNSSFNDTEHLAREFNASTKQLAVKFHYQVYQEHFKGLGLVVYANSNECIILHNKTLHKVKNGTHGQVILKLKAAKLKTDRKVNRVNFVAISLDSLNRLLHYNFINEAHITANQKVDLITANEVKNGFFFNVANEYNPKFISSIKDSLSNNSGTDKLRLIQEIEIEENQIKTENQEYYKMVKQLSLAEKKIKSNPDEYTEDALRSEIIRLKTSIKGFNLKTVSSSLLKLKSKLKEQSKAKPKDNLSFSGEVVYFLVPQKFNYL